MDPKMPKLTLRGVTVQGSPGFTLVELMVVVAIVAIIATIAVPSFNDFVAKNRVKGAAEEIYGLILQAKSEAPIRDTNISINIDSGADPWCVGFSTVAGCDCDADDECVVPVGADATQVLQVVDGTEYNGVTIAETFNTGTTFTLPRSSATQAGTITVTSGVWQLNVVVSTQGRIRVCNPVNNNTMPGYEAC